MPYILHSFIVCIMFDLRCYHLCFLVVLAIKNVQLSFATSILAEDSKELECEGPPMIKHGSFRLLKLHSRLNHGTFISSENLSSPNSHFIDETNFLSFDHDIISQVTYPEGSVIEYFCKPSFWIHSPPSKITCHMGKWLGDIPLCVAKGCVQPTNIMNGFYLELFESSDNLYPPGARLQFVCHSGYLLNGPDMFNCDQMGNWSPENLPECVPSPRIINSKKCSVPPDIWGSNRKLVRGIVGGDSAVHGTEVEYRCRPGFRNILAPCVTHTLTCRQGEWRGTSPQCEEFTSCIAPPNIDNGLMYEVASSYPLQSQVYYSCEQGYRLLGPSVLTCEESGCWTPNMPPVCQLSHRFSGSEADRTPFNIHSLLVAAISGIIAVFFLLLALLLYHRALSPKVMRLRSSGSGSELQPHHASPCAPNGHISTDHDPDRVALIGFPDEMISRTEGVPPTYEEAVRQRPALLVDHQNGRFTPHVHRSRGHRVVVASGVRRQRHRDNPDNISYQSIGSARQSSGTSRSMSVRSWSACDDSLGSSDTVAISDSTNVTVDTMSSGAASAASQATSCRGLAGSRASFDTSSLINNEDAPLLEEEAEGEESRDDADQFSLSTRDSDSLKDNVSHTRSVTVSLPE